MRPFRALAVRSLAAISLVFGLAIAAAHSQLAMPAYLSVLLSCVLLVGVPASGGGRLVTSLLAVTLGTLVLLVAVWGGSSNQSAATPVGFPPTPLERYVIVTVVALGLVVLAYRAGQSARRDRSPAE